MDALKKERLAAAGIDVDGALERFLGYDALLERFLKKFLADGNYAALSAAVAAGDPAAALTALQKPPRTSHTPSSAFFEPPYAAAGRFESAHAMKSRSRILFSFAAATAYCRSCLMRPAV